MKAPAEIDLPKNIFDSFSVPPALIAELRHSSAAYRGQKQFSALPLSLSVTRLPKLNLTDAEALSYALIPLIIICYAAEEGGQIEKAPECYALTVACNFNSALLGGRGCRICLSSSLAKCCCSSGE